MGGRKLQASNNALPSTIGTATPIGMPGTHPHHTPTTAARAPYLLNAILLFCIGISSRSSMLVHWLNTMTLSGGATAAAPPPAPPPPPPGALGSGGSFRSAPTMRLSDLDLTASGLADGPELRTMDHRYEWHRYAGTSSNRHAICLLTARLLFSLASMQGVC